MDELVNLIGKKCLIKDTDESPHLKEYEGCFACAVWEAIDSYYIPRKEVLEAIGDDEYTLDNRETYDAAWIDGRDELRREIKQKLHLEDKEEQSK